MKTTGKWPPRVWEAVQIKAQDGHAPSWYALLVWARLIKDNQV